MTLHLRHDAGLIAALAILFLIASIPAAPLPVDQLWEVSLSPGRITFGPNWAEEGAIHVLAGVGTRVKEVIDGRIVTTSPYLGGVVTALDREDVDQAEGVEVLVAVKGDTLSELLVLDGRDFQVMSRLILDNNPNTETTALAWLEGYGSLIVVRTTYTEYNNPAAHIQESTRSARLTKINLDGEQFGEPIECGFGAIKRWRDEDNIVAGYVIFGTRRTDTFSSGFRFGFKRFMLTTLNSAGRVQYAEDIWSGDYDEADGQAHLGGTTIAPLPDGGFATFEAFMTPGWFTPGLGHIYAHTADNLEQLVLNADLDSIPHSLAYLPPEASAEGRPFLLCAFDRGGIRLFDLESLTFNQQEYVWDPCWTMLQSGDFDEDGQVELFGMSGEVLTCARMQQLDVKTDPSALTPSLLSLSAFPNPFNSSTTINYTLPTPGRYAIDVIDIQGRLVTRLASGWKEAGSYWKVWEAKEIPGGIYYFKLSTNSSETVNSTVLIK